MHARDIPIDEEGALGLCRLLLRAVEPSEPRFPVQRVVEPVRKPGVWERLDRWFAKTRQRDRERYLAQARDVFELETRIRALDRRPYY
jgi:hypothetical protein